MRRPIYLAIEIVLILMLVSGCGRQREAEQDAALVSSGGAAPIARLKQGEADKQGLGQEQLLSPEKFGREDPFGPIVGEVEVVEEDSFGLKGISWDAGQPLAIIDGVVVGVGDEISGKRVIRIDRDKVILEDGITQYELRLAK